MTFISMLTGKALRVKGDGSVDGLGEPEDPGCELFLFFLFVCISFLLLMSISMVYEKAISTQLLSRGFVIVVYLRAKMFDS